MIITPEFWQSLDQLVASSELVIDRPRRSEHPRYPNLIYPHDYGYLEGTTTVDGEGLDVFVGSSPGRIVNAIALTVDLAKRDAELKLLLGTTHSEQQEILNFLNGASMRASLIVRNSYLDWLRSRRSVRRFKPQIVSAETIRRLLETAIWSPSAHNRQPWRFAVLESYDSRRRLASEMRTEHQHDLLASGISPDQVQIQVERSYQRICEAPLGILLCLDSSVGDKYPDPKRQQAEFLMGVQSLALAGGTLLLAAHAEGLGAVWICAPLFAPDAARRSLTLPSDWQPQALLLLGYSDQEPAPKQRIPVDEITRYF